MMCKTTVATFTCKPGDCATSCTKRVAVRGELRIPVLGVLSNGKLYPTERNASLAVIQASESWSFTALTQIE